MSVADLQKKAPGLDFNAYFTAMGLTLDSLNVGQPDYIKFTTNLINTYNVDDIKAYLAWNIINDAAKYLDDETQMERFNFYGKTLSGKKEMFPRWKRCVSTVNASLGEAVGEMYAKKYFPPQAKERMLTLVENLRIALGQRIDSLEWMSPATKQNAHKKIRNISCKSRIP